jgi:hypothetical protein
LSSPGGRAAPTEGSPIRGRPNNLWARIRPTACHAFAIRSRHNVKQQPITVLMERRVNIREWPDLIRRVAGSGQYRTEGFVNWKRVAFVTKILSQAQCRRTCKLLSQTPRILTRDRPGCCICLTWHLYHLSTLDSVGPRGGKRRKKRGILVCLACRAGARRT